MKNRTLQSLKRIALVVLAGLILVCSASGCGGTGNIGSTVVDTDNDTDQPVELSVMFWEIEDVGRDMTLPVIKTISEKLGITIKPLSTPFSSYNDKLNSFIASNQIPDIFWFNGFESIDAYTRYIRDGLILSISDNDDKLPNLKKHVDLFSYTMQATDGKMYGVPAQSYVEEVALQNPHTYYFRKDWLDKLHLSVPTNLEEFRQVMYAFAKNDPDGNGANDTFGFTAMQPNAIWHFYPLFNANLSDLQRMEKVGDTYQPMLFNEGGLKTVKLLNQFIKDGVLDSEFMMNTQDKLIEKFVTGKVGCVLLNTGDFYANLRDMVDMVYEDQGLTADDIVTYSPALKNINGEQKINGFDNFYGLTCISGVTSDEKKIKALKLLDYICSDEGRMLFRYGLENETYRKEKGQIINLIEKGNDGYPLYLRNVDPAQALGCLMHWDANFVAPGKKDSEKIAASTTAWMECELVGDPLAYLRIDPNVLDPTVKASCWDFTVTTLTNIISMSTDVDKDFADYKQKWLSMGGQQLIDETNRAAKEAGM